MGSVQITGKERCLFQASINHFQVDKAIVIAGSENGNDLWSFHLSEKPPLQIEYEAGRQKSCYGTTIISPKNRHEISWFLY